MVVDTKNLFSRRLIDSLKIDCRNNGIIANEVLFSQSAMSININTIERY